MPEIKGKLVICNRCGQTHFRKYIGQGVTDGGYTTWDKYEALPQTWLYESQIGYLCPTCAGMFRVFIDKLMDGKNIAPAWAVLPEDECTVEDLMSVVTKDKEVSNGQD